MVASRYNLLMPLSRGWLVFNTLHLTAARLSDGLARQMQSGTSCSLGPPTVWRRFQPTSHPQLSLQAGEAEALAALGMVASSQEEEAEVWERLLQSQRHPKVLKLTLAYTAACQMNCGYCFEAGRDQRLKHSPVLARRVVAFVEQYLEEHRGLQGIHLGLFGGEPLLEPELAEGYLESVARLARRRGLNFEASLTSNGLLLEVTRLARWSRLGLNYVRTTLDGPPAVHNRRRPLLGGGPTFERILARLVEVARVLPKLGLGLAINLDEQNQPSLGWLLDILEHQGLKDSLEILLEPTLGKFPRPPRKQGRLLGLAAREVVQRRFFTPLIPGLCQPCNFTQDHNFIIDWSGHLSRCSFTMLDPKGRVGHVQEGVQPVNQDLLQLARSPLGKCKAQQCAYLPLCGGGCRHEAALQGGGWGGPNCPLELWDEALGASLPLRYPEQPPVLSDGRSCTHPRAPG